MPRTPHSLLTDPDEVERLVRENPSEGARVDLPPHVLASDVDGDRDLVLHPESDIDPRGLVLVTVDADGEELRHGFRRETVWVSGDQANQIGIGHQTQRWVAPCQHGCRPVRLEPSD